MALALALASVAASLAQPSLGLATLRGSQPGWVMPQDFALARVLALATAMETPQAPLELEMNRKVGPWVAPLSMKAAYILTIEVLAEKDLATLSLWLLLRPR